MTVLMNVTGYDFGGCNEADKDEAVSIFETVLLQTLGGTDDAKAAKEAADAVFEKYGEWPAEAATPEEVAIYEHWQNAENEAALAAFEGWSRPPSGAHFVVSFWTR